MVLHLKAILKRKGILSKELSKKIGVSEVSVSNWMTGKTLPTLEMLENISQVLEVPVWYLFASENDLLDIHKSLQTNIFVCPNCGETIEICLKQKSPSK